MRTWQELERLTVGARIAEIVRSPEGDESILIITDRAHPESPRDLLAVRVYLEDGKVEVSTEAVYRKTVC